MATKEKLSSGAIAIEKNFCLIWNQHMIDIVQRSTFTVWWTITTIYYWKRLWAIYQESFITSMVFTPPTLITRAIPPAICFKVGTLPYWLKRIHTAKSFRDISIWIIRAGLADRPSEYRWSSNRRYIRKKKKTAWFKRWRICCTVTRIHGRHTPSIDTCRDAGIVSVKARITRSRQMWRQGDHDSRPWRREIGMVYRGGWRGRPRPRRDRSASSLLSQSPGW